jgi:hypothetical protein
MPYSYGTTKKIAAITSNFCDSQNVLFDVFYLSCDIKNKYVTYETALYLGLSGSDLNAVEQKPYGFYTLVAKPLREFYSGLYDSLHPLYRRVMFTREFVFYSDLDALAVAIWYHKRLKNELFNKGYHVGYSGFMISKKR